MNSEAETVNRNFFQKAVLILILLFTIHFWNLKYIPQKYNAENLLTWMICGLSFMMVIKKGKMCFTGAILFFIFGLLINTLAAYVHIHQSPFKTLLSYSFYYFILFYFFLHYLKPDRKFLEKLIITFGIIYSFIYVVQYAVYPYVLFSEDALTAEGGKQFAIVGHGFHMLAYLIVLNRYLVERKLKDLLLAFGFFVVLLLCDFRTLIAGAFLVSAFMVFRLIKLTPRDILLIVMVIILMVGISQVKFVKDIIADSISNTESNFKEGKKYIRMLEMEFFFKRFPTDNSYYIIGGGKRTGDNLNRFNPDEIGLNYNIVWVDIGLLGFYIMIGLVAVVGMLWYTGKAMFIRLPRDGLYLNMYFFYLIIVSFTNEEIYRDGIFSVHALGLYLIDYLLNEKSKLQDRHALGGN
jgi:hypothetical protein